MSAQAAKTTRSGGKGVARGATTPRQMLAEKLAARLPGCSLSWKFGGGSLDVDGKVFAFTRTNEGVAMKLPESRIDSLLKAERVAHLVMGKRTMREWVVVEDGLSARTLALLKEALRFVSSISANEQAILSEKPRAMRARRAAKS